MHAYTCRYQLSHGSGATFPFRCGVVCRNIHISASCEPPLPRHGGPVTLYTRVHGTTFRCVCACVCACVRTRSDPTSNQSPSPSLLLLLLLLVQEIEDLGVPERLVVDGIQGHHPVGTRQIRHLVQIQDPHAGIASKDLGKEFLLRSVHLPEPLGGGVPEGRGAGPAVAGNTRIGKASLGVGPVQVVGKGELPHHRDAARILREHVLDQVGHRRQVGVKGRALPLGGPDHVPCHGSEDQGERLVVL
mmetsp:Transcript_7356/g.21390  ORF Transcript_7356/g.21390 Transcript_7356/m.21390 type:complete len:246 (+) Transcript_7356:630-1367(+)